MSETNFFTLTIEEVQIISKYRTLAKHQQKGVLQAIDLLKPPEDNPATKRKKKISRKGLDKDV